MSQRDARGRFVKARPFQVGDRVNGKMGESGPVKTGEIIPTEESVKCLSGAVSILTDDPGSRERRSFWAYAYNLTLLKPAPQPKTEARRVDVDLLIAERDGLLVLKAEHEQEIATLKAEVERLNHSLADTRSEMMENYHQFSQARDRAEAAEAKLADIKAIKRVQELEPNLPATKLIQRVLDGAA